FIHSSWERRKPLALSLLLLGILQPDPPSGAVSGWPTQGSAGPTDGEIQQSPSFIVEKGSSVGLHCKQTNKHDYMYWYQQHQQKGPQLLFYSPLESFPVTKEAKSDRFTADRLRKEDFFLNISSVETEDSDTYFCASSSHSSSKFLCLLTRRERQGVVLDLVLFNVFINDLDDGTETVLITFTDDPIRSSNAEVKQPWSLVLPEGESASLICSQSNDHLRMLWYRQDRGQGLQLLFNFYNKEEQEKGTVPDRFTAEQPQEKQCILNISSAEPGDSVVLHTAFQSGT
ncbi:immunoglobulin kappa light chain-like, partial [Sceloporus undulatus]|uniref:immunoglobulin kappa light chain-like n=1 Tax=Sceloporus undulatus TaxID=8520 RepID=UPI001C4C3D9A